MINQQKKEEIFNIIQVMMKLMIVLKTFIINKLLKIKILVK